MTAATSAALGPVAALSPATAPNASAWAWWWPRNSSATGNVADVNAGAAAVYAATAASSMLWAYPAIVWSSRPCAATRELTPRQQERDGEHGGTGQSGAGEEPAPRGARRVEVEVGGLLGEGLHALVVEVVDVLRQRLELAGGEMHGCLL